MKITLDEGMPGWMKVLAFTGAGIVIVAIGVFYVFLIIQLVDLLTALFNHQPVTERMVLWGVLFVLTFICNPWDRFTNKKG